MYQDDFINNVINVGVDSHEMRLNGAGLKMLYSKKSNDITISICGDQVEDYPEFVKEARKTICHFGFERRL